MNKINYILNINKSAKDLKFSFSYGNTRNISLALNRIGAIISFDMERDYSKNIENSYLYNLLKEAIKRIALLYILQYQKPLEIKKIELFITRQGQKTEIIDLSDSMVFYQMVDKPLLRNINAEWKNRDILQNLLTYQKSKENNLSRAFAALYAYLFSKTKKKETERFNYLWIAMNGFITVTVGKENTSDKQQMNTFVQLYKIGNRVLKATGNNRSQMGKLTMIQMLNLSEPVTKENLIADSVKPFSEYVKSICKKYNFDLTPYGFLLTDFPYFLRCTLFHAHRPIELFSFENDMELKSLRIVNGLIEEFLDNNIHSLFLLE